MNAHPPGLPASHPPRTSYDDPLTEQQTRWLMTLANEAATGTAETIARGMIRLGVAHRLLCLSHLAVLIDHQGREATEAWLLGQMDTYCDAAADLKRGPARGAA